MIEYMIIYDEKETKAIVISYVGDDYEYPSFTCQKVLSKEKLVRFKKKTSRRKNFNFHMKTALMRKLSKKYNKTDESFTDIDDIDSDIKNKLYNLIPNPVWAQKIHREVEEEYSVKVKLNWYSTYDKSSNATRSTVSINENRRENVYSKFVLLHELGHSIQGQIQVEMGHQKGFWSIVYKLYCKYDVLECAFKNEYASGQKLLRKLHSGTVKPFDFDQYKLLDNPLCIAIENNNVEMVHFLIKSGADVNAKRKKYGQNEIPLELAIQSCNMDILKLLIANDAKVPKKMRLCSSIKNQNWDIIEYIVEKGADVNHGPDKCTDLCRTYYNINNIEKLSLYGFNIPRWLNEIFNRDNFIPEYIIKNEELIKYCLDNINVFKKDNMNNFVGAIVAYSDKRNIIERALSHIPDINMEICNEDEKQTLLHIAIVYENIEAVKLLLQKGAITNNNINYQDRMIKIEILKLIAENV